MENIKKEINQLLSSYRIKQNTLRKCLECAYDETSRTPEYIAKFKNQPSRQAMNKIWEEYGIPHQIFLNLQHYVIVEEDNTEASTKASE